jgi:hypothetical protein
MIKKIVSGGQTGADQGALDAAICCGVEHGGWCPKGRLSEAGPIPARFNLTETGSKDYLKRTEKNVIDSDPCLFVRASIGRDSAKGSLLYPLDS